MTEMSQQLELLNLPTTGLPDYRIRESKRARHVSIKVHLTGDIEVVVPPALIATRCPRFCTNDEPGCGKRCNS